MSSFILKIHQNESLNLSNLDPDELSKTWRMCTKVKDSLEEGSRLENLSWRVWFRRHDVKRLDPIPHKSDSPELVDIYFPLNDSNLYSKEIVASMEYLENNTCYYCGGTSLDWKQSLESKMVCEGCCVKPKLQTQKRNTECSNCGTNDTPLWRRCPKNTVLCNACGLYLKLHGENRPLSMNRGVIRKRQRAERWVINKKTENPRYYQTTGPGMGILTITK